MSEAALPRFPKRSGKRKSPTKSAGSLLEAGGLRVATYTRISTDEGNQPYSLEAQAEHLSRFLSMRPEWTLVKEYTDQMTGSKLERPGLQRLLADVRAGKVDAILVYRVDRFSRSLRHLQELIQVLEDESVVFVSATEPFDTSNSMGRMVLNILGVFAEFERSILIDRIRAGNAAKASRGEWVGGKPPYGYQVTDGKTLQIIEHEAAVVRDVFRMCADQNLGGLNIAQRLNKDGLRTREGTEWDAKKIINILRRPTYAGWIVHHDETYAGLHPAIIDPDLFDKVQSLLDERGTPWDRRSASLDYKLSGLLTCTNCGSSMIAERTNSGSGNSYRYYICRRRKLVARTACHSPRISADVLEKAVLDSLVAVYRDYGLFRQAAQRAITERQERMPQTLEQLRTIDQEIAKTEASVNRYLTAFEAGTMDVALCAPRLTELQGRLDSLTLRRNELQLIADSPTPKLPSARDTKAMADALERELAERTGPELKALLRALIERVHVSPDRVITPYLRVPDIGPVAVDPVRPLSDAAADPAVAGPVAVSLSVSSDRLWSVGRTRDKVLEVLSELERAGEGPEFPTARLVDETLKRWPNLKRDTVWRIINKDMCRSRGGRPISLVKVRQAVLRRATAEEVAASQMEQRPIR